MSQEIIRRRIRFYGWVQGVGFRYRARYAADAEGATGWVRNEFDGSVTMEIQGTEESIDKVIQKLDSDRYIWIHGMETNQLRPKINNHHYRILNIFLFFALVYHS